VIVDKQAGSRPEEEEEHALENSTHIIQKGMREDSEVREKEREERSEGRADIWYSCHPTALSKTIPLSLPPSCAPVSQSDSLFTLIECQHAATNGQTGEERGNDQEAFEDKSVS